MTGKEFKGGLIGVGFVILGWLSGMIISSKPMSSFASFTFVLVLSMGFVGGMRAARNGMSRQEFAGRE